MSILPSMGKQNYNASITDYPTDTWIISDGRIIGMGSGQEAMRQAADIILNVERFRYQIFSPSFGVELNSLVGKDPEYVESMLKRRVSEALLTDKRILSVDGFTFEHGEMGSVYCTFDVNTVFGRLKKEVRIENL